MQPQEKAPDRSSATSGNLLIQGDNLEALKALLPFYRGQVKCIFIDPPYNTQSAFEHYDDNLEHAHWLSMMLPRLQLLRELLSEDGSIWVTIDDNEGHYLKVLMDEVFGRGNFVTTIAWQQRTTRENRKTFSSNHEFLLVYAKSQTRFSATRNDLSLTEEVKARYKNPDNDPRGAWQSVSANAQAGHGTAKQFYTLVAPNGKRHDPPMGTCWRYTLDKVTREIASNNIWFSKDGDGVPRIKKFLTEAKAGLTPETLWLADDVGTNDFAKKHLIELFRDGTLFDTPKPESLISQVIHIASNPGDLVLDSFLGSGTTAAVAHKMGRRWIGIEMGEHAATHCLPRLQKVIDGEQGGISKAVNWQGCGGFRFMALGAPVFDEHGRIHPDVRFATLAAFIWQQETGSAWRADAAQAGTPCLGTHYELDSCLRTPDMRESPISFIKTPKFACYLLFNGILGDKRPASGNVLTQGVLDAVLALHAQTPAHTAPLRVFGEACRLGPERLKQANVTFRHIPYDVKAR
ncbi:site-specific DNA-methyltransferase [Polaromonas sp. CG_9.11]|uniref:site-specific DNA-methyltransferase n=1 Tax=Polaromonas sp. CG_9.11 TaxID=2787730 RepID=UPI001A35FDE0|nr:site-specific DNA-methyltransferase [Polaromonas sp. CG_9.11]MBG6076864.1 adenine-specific DNA-methyltransferase [Polaromonas sp. CG_9.11]